MSILIYNKYKRNELKTIGNELKTIGNEKTP